MTRDEIREIANIVGDDKRYAHFVNRINKEFDLSDDQRNSNVYVLFSKDNGKKAGFSVIGYSPAKMKLWEKTFKDEGWTDKDFTIDAENVFELMYMYTRPENRGKGLGDKLFDQAMEFSRKKGATEVLAYVSDVDDTALRFYKKKKAEIIQDFTDEDTSAAFVKWTL